MSHTLEQQKANRKKLVQELRTTKLKQGVRFLRRDDEYCFEGLACDVSGLHSWILANETFRKIYRYGERNIAVMPKDVMDFYGFKTVNGWYQREDKLFRDNLTNRNDAGLTFPQLADIIEEEPEGLFFT